MDARLHHKVYPLSTLGKERMQEIVNEIDKEWLSVDYFETGFDKGVNHRTYIPKEKNGYADVTAFKISSHNFDCVTFCAGTKDRLKEILDEFNLE